MVPPLIAALQAELTRFLHKGKGRGMESLIHRRIESSIRVPGLRRRSTILCSGILEPPTVRYATNRDGIAVFSLDKGRDNVFVNAFECDVPRRTPQKPTKTLVLKVGAREPWG